MKDLSFLFLKNSLAFKMKKGFKNLCTGDTSTSTLNQQRSSPEFMETETSHQPTLEEMIMQLDLEEKMAAAAAARPSLDHHHRMSCVNSSDILRSARNALNQYPRFSLDGKDSMYRSSFRNFDHVPTSSIRNRRSIDHGQRRCLPSKVAGERVIWCKPGVVGKLMGLDAMPIPVRLKHKINFNSCLVRRQNLRRSTEKQDFERRKVDTSRASCSKTANRYCLMKPLAVEVTSATDEVGWPMRRYL